MQHIELNPMSWRKNEEKAIQELEKQLKNDQIDFVDKLTLIEYFVKMPKSLSTYMRLLHLLDAFMLEEKNFNSSKIKEKFNSLYSSLNSQINKQLKQLSEEAFMEKNIFDEFSEVFNKYLEEEVEKVEEKVKSDQIKLDFSKIKVKSIADYKTAFDKALKTPDDEISKATLLIFKKALTEFDLRFPKMIALMAYLDILIKIDIFTASSLGHAVLIFERLSRNMENSLNGRNFLSSKTYGGIITHESFEVLRGTQDSYLSPKSREILQRDNIYLNVNKDMHYYEFGKAIPFPGTLTGAYAFGAEVPYPDKGTIRLTALQTVEEFQKLNQKKSSKGIISSQTSLPDPPDLHAAMWKRMQLFLVGKSEEYINEFYESILDKAEMAKFILNHEEDIESIKRSLITLIQAIQLEAEDKEDVAEKKSTKKANKNPTKTNKKPDYKNRIEFLKEMMAATPVKLQQELDLPDLLLKYCARDLKSANDLYQFLKQIKELPKSEKLNTLLEYGKLIQDDNQFNILKIINDLLSSNQPIKMEELIYYFIPGGRKLETGHLTKFNQFFHGLRDYGVTGTLTDEEFDKLMKDNKPEINAASSLTEVEAIKKFLNGIALPNINPTTGKLEPQATKFKQLLYYINHTTQHQLLKNLASNRERKTDLQEEVGQVLVTISNNEVALTRRFDFLKSYDEKSQLPDNLPHISQDTIEDIKNLYVFFKLNEKGINYEKASLARIEDIILKTLVQKIASEQDPNDKSFKKKLLYARNLLDKNTKKVKKLSPFEEYENLMVEILASRKGDFKEMIDILKTKISVADKVDYIDSNHGFKLDDGEKEFLERLKTVLKKFKEELPEKSAEKTAEKSIEKSSKKIKRGLTEKQLPKTGLFGKSRTSSDKALPTYKKTKGEESSSSSGSRSSSDEESKKSTIVNESVTESGLFGSSKPSKTSLDPQLSNKSKNRA